MAKHSNWQEGPVTSIFSKEIQFSMNGEAVEEEVGEANAWLVSKARCSVVPYVMIGRLALKLIEHVRPMFLGYHSPSRALFPAFLACFCGWNSLYHSDLLELACVQGADLSQD